MRRNELVAELSRVSRTLLSEDDVQHTLDRAVASAIYLIDECDHAGVSIVRQKQHVDTPAATSEVARRGDQLQYELNEGPCLDAIWKQETISCVDLSNDPRFPVWGPRVVEELGVRSMQCFQLFTDNETLGALNLYSETVGGFIEGKDAEGLALAAHVAIALASAQKVEHLNLAILNRTAIGQAEGILMERFDISAQQAFTVLTRVSQDRNIKLRDIAIEIVATRLTPGL